MRLYHASASVIEHPDVFHSRKYLDFGQVFYLTSLYEQAIQYAKRFLGKNSQAYVNVYELSDDIQDIRKKVFEHYDAEWLDFIGNCRKGLPVETYDMIEGGIANDRVFNTLDLFFNGLISRDEALGRLVFEHPNHQLCILNQSIIDKYLYFVEVQEIKQGGNYASE